jgi:hypothetical protein
LPILAIEREHDLVLPGVKTVREQPRRKRGTRQPGSRMQPAHSRCSVSLGHVFLSIRTGGTIAHAAICTGFDFGPDETLLPAIKTAAACL